MSDIAINQVLSQMRTMASQASMEGAKTTEEVGEVSNFAEMMGKSITEVNEALQTSKTMQAQFESGDPSVSLAEVMVTAQKASIQFAGMTEVRNKLLNAYQEIMNMPV